MDSTQTPVSLSRSQKRKKRKSTQQRKQSIIKAIDVVIDGLVRLDCTTNVDFYDALGKFPLTFSDAVRYVALRKAAALLGDYKSQLEGTQSMPENPQFDQLRRSVYNYIQAEEAERRQYWLPELTAGEKKQIIRSVFKEGSLRILLQALFQVGKSDRVTDLIEEARKISGEDSVQVEELERLCVERFVDLCYEQLLIDKRL